MALPLQSVVRWGHFTRFLVQWDYPQPSGTRYDDGDVGLHEVYYDDQGTPVMMTEQPVGFVASAEEGAQGLIRSLELALQDAQNRPILDSRDIPGTIESIPTTQ